MQPIQSYPCLLFPDLFLSAPLPPITLQMHQRETAQTMRLIVLHFLWHQHLQDAYMVSILHGSLGHQLSSHKHHSTAENPAQLLCFLAEVFSPTFNPSLLRPPINWQMSNLENVTDRHLPLRVSPLSRIVALSSQLLCRSPVLQTPSFVLLVIHDSSATS